MTTKEREEKLSIYIHIPFCRKKCWYCSFYSVPLREELQRGYLEALCREIDYYSRSQLTSIEIETIYLGGGTPSLLSPKEVNQILNKCSSAFHIASEAEITLEANPESLSRQKLKAYQKSGCNRLSLGVQSFNNRELQLLGRLHTAEQAIRSYSSARKVGFSNVNIDLMGGIPHQTSRSLLKSLHTLAKLSPDHISFYLLELKGTSPPALTGLLPKEEIIERLYWTAADFLTDLGYQHYEISNFASPGKVARHNLRYWQDEPYLGLGPSAHSYTINSRFWNVSDVEEYIKLINQHNRAVAGQEEVTPNRRIEDALILGLRYLQGIELSRFYKRYGVHIFDRYSEELKSLGESSLIETTDDFLRLTRKGILLSNEVFQQFISP
ncbi:coproporphyrinogen III oxidase [bacterium (candidate division B38) B3_B38]|nr:MAG: coproporphyrinogen III oxidase [bacterium (candidate division B38) B3_B38]